MLLLISANTNAIYFFWCLRKKGVFLKARHKNIIIIHIIITLIFYKLNFIFYFKF